MTARTTAALRVLMLVVIAVVALANAIGWVDPDLWIPFVCIIAVMGVGTRGGVLDSLAFVGLEVVVVLVLGVATFSGSRDFVWAASVAVSVLAVGKIGLLEMHRADARDARARRQEAGRSSAPGARASAPGAPSADSAGAAAPSQSAVRPRVFEPVAGVASDGAADDAEPQQPLGTVSAEEAARPAPSSPTPSPDQSDGAGAGSSAPGRPKRRRERDDATPVHLTR